MAGLRIKKITEGKYVRGRFIPNSAKKKAHRTKKVGRNSRRRNPAKAFYQFTINGTPWGKIYRTKATAKRDAKKVKYEFGRATVRLKRFAPIRRGR